MVDIKALKKKSKNNLDKIKGLLSDKKGYNKEDERFWKLTRDKAMNGSAVIRFLPGLEDDLPLVELYSHGFKSPYNQYYFENCPTTIENPCPVCEHNSILWKTGIEENRAIVRGVKGNGRKRKLAYVSNILVINDPAEPSNNGKVFLFKYGAKIMDKISALVKPKFEDQEEVDIFDWFTGANFRLRSSKVEGYPNYDQSAFDPPSPITDDEIEKIYDQQYSIKEFIDPKEYKSYDELKARFYTVMKKPDIPENFDSVGSVDYTPNSELREPPEPENGESSIPFDVGVESETPKSDSQPVDLSDLESLV